MFSRRHQKSSSWSVDTRIRYDTPLDELIGSLDRVEEIVKNARSAWDEDQNTVESAPSSGGFAASFRSRRSAAGKPKEDETPEKKPANKFGRNKEEDAKIIPIFDEDELVELLRRIAELVVLGEKSVAQAEVQEEKRRAHRRMSSDGVFVPKPMEKPKLDAASNAAMFEHFFERNALSLIVNIATGVAFRASNDNEEDENLDDETKGSCSTAQSDCTLLPPLPIATQAIQSVSILIQNVSRATSLYFLLSNNHINELIDLPLELYSVAERSKRDSPRRSASPEIAELTTHFISFLKSLAMRMNVETLQFFLTYPSESADFGHDAVAASDSHFRGEPSAFEEEEDGPMDEVRSYKQAKPPVNQPVPVQAVKVEFPLYRRALEFCAAHQDSFVRVTAMNICLNTLRLATVSPAGPESPDSKAAENNKYGSSPDGVLHNAKPLPLKERLAIAQHVCAPARVAGLVSPVFTKLAELWGLLEEYFREMDSIEESSSRAGSGTALDDRRRTAKVEKAREETRRRRVVSNFQDAAASIQDELLMLEDVLKVRTIFNVRRMRASTSNHSRFHSQRLD